MEGRNSGKAPHAKAKPPNVSIHLAHSLSYPTLTECIGCPRDNTSHHGRAACFTSSTSARLAGQLYWVGTSFRLILLCVSLPGAIVTSSNSQPSQSLSASRPSIVSCLGALVSPKRYATAPWSKFFRPLLTALVPGVRRCM